MAFWDFLPDWWGVGQTRSVRTGGPAYVANRAAAKAAEKAAEKAKDSATPAQSGTEVFGVTGGDGRVDGPTPKPGPSAADLAAARAEAEAAAAKRRAGQAFQNMAGNLDPQIKALQRAIDKEFKKNLDQNLEDVGLLIQEQMTMLKSQQGARAKQFLATGRSNAIAGAAQEDSSLENLVRERQDTLGQVLLQGAGQTDALRAMVESARNWRNNVDEGNRAYFDTLNSINSGISENNLDTQTSLANVFTQGEQERERLWSDYFNRRSESYTNLGNLYQQQADYLEQAKQQEVGGGGGSKKSSAGDAFMKASEEMGKSYVKKGLPDWISKYQGQEELKSTVTNSNLAAAVRFEPLGNPEGASSRRLR